MEEMAKNKKEKISRKNWAWKFLKFIFFAYLIIFFVWLLISNYMSDKKTIYEKIGTMSPQSISIKDALNIKGYAITTYADYIQSGNTEAAYDMLTEEYKKFVSYDEFLKTLEGIDFATFDMKEIKMKAEGTYIATVVYKRDGEEKETEYLLYLNDVNPKIIKISPNKFIYNYSNLKFKEENIELVLQECNVYTDNIQITAIIKNTSMFDQMAFKNVGVGYGDTINKAQNIEFSLAPGESKKIEIEYETNYYIPNNIKIKRLLDEDTLRTYTFYFKDTK